MATVRLQSVSKKFGLVTAVEDVTLDINNGEFVVFVGPSGCGKTTTLRMVAGLEQPSSGEIFIGERPVTRVAPKDRNIAMVFQEYGLYPHMTIYNNLAYPLKLKGMPRAEIDAQVKETARLLQIDKLLKRKPGQLSGGQRQRVALGRAIVRKPAVFLMDEPLSNLDAKLRVQMREELILLQRMLAVTTIYVTHDQVEALTMGDRLVVMLDGKVQQVGTPLQMYHEPVNQYVASFIGQLPMNFFSAIASIREGIYALEVQVNGGQGLIPYPTMLPKLHDGDSVTVGIRAEDVLISEGGQGSGKGAIPGEVIVVEQLGSDVLYHVQSEIGRFTVRSSPELQFKRNTHVNLSLNPNRIKLFDPSNGQAIY